jgi:hypothetical protein
MAEMETDKKYREGLEALDNAEMEVKADEIINRDGDQFADDVRSELMQQARFRLLGR